MAKLEYKPENVARVYLGDGTRSLPPSLSFSAPQEAQSWPIIHAPVDALNMDLATLQAQVRELKGDVAGKKDLAAMNERIEKIAASLDRATERGQELKARVLLPPPEHLSVQLVPSYSLDRLEEYRADEKKAYALFGTFFGGTLGIFSNWAIQDTFTFSKAAVVLIFFLLILTIAAGIWAWQIDTRVQRVRRIVFPSVCQNAPEASSRTGADEDGANGEQHQSPEPSRVSP